MNGALLVLRPRVLAAAPQLAERLLTLNNDHSVELSRLELNRMVDLIAGAFVALSIENGGALLISFDQDAGYDNPNFKWFHGRFERFVYVDRIVVSRLARGRGYARMLYETLFLRAQAAGHDRIVCEINTDPPNPGSDAFHAGFGFVEVGRGAIHGGAKSVRYMSRCIA
jgi:predicted GNAT superfamily acetyltransferase